mgnify:CR=1 FL=1
MICKTFIKIILGKLPYKNIFKISFPIIISGLAINIVNITDTIFLSNLSEVALGAAGNAGTKEFQEMAAEVGRMKKVIIDTDLAVDGIELWTLHGK